MDLKNIFKIDLFRFSIILISVISIFFMYNLCKYSCFWGDDFYYAMYQDGEKLFDCLIGGFRYEHGGYYLGKFLCKFLSFGLPNMFHIHPAEFINTGHSLFRSVFSIITILSITNFVCFFKKSKKLYILIFIFTTLYFYLFGLQSTIFSVNYNWYRYFFSLFFFSVFWNYIFKSILSSDFSYNKKSILKVLLISLCGFIIGTSIEIMIFSSLLLSFIIIFYSKLSNLKYNLNINIYLPFCSQLLGAYLFISSSGFRNVASVRGLNNVMLSFDIIKEYTALYLQKCIYNEYSGWGIGFYL